MCKNFHKIIIINFIVIFAINTSGQNVAVMMNDIENHILSIRKPPLRDIDTKYDIHVKDYGAIANDAQDDYSAIVNALNAAKLIQGSVKVLFDKGKYLVSPPNGSAALAVSGINNLVVDGNGAEMIIKRQLAGFSYISGSENVIIRNFSVDYDPLPFAECVVQSVSIPNGYFIVKVDPGYPVLNDPIFKNYTNWGLIKDPVFPGKVKDNTPNHITATNIIEIGDRLYMIFPANVEYLSLFNANDRYTHVFRPGETASSGRVRNSKNVTFQNLTINASPSLVYGSFYSENVNILACSTIVKSGRYTVSNADGLHVQANRFGPWVEDCEFSGSSDDAVNIYANPLFIIAKVGANQLEMNSVTGVAINDIISFWKRSTGDVLAELKVVGINGNLLTFERAVPTLNLPPAGTTFDSKLWAQNYDHAYNVSGIGNYFVFRNNYFHDSNRFGLYLKSSYGLIQNNRIYRTSNSGIRVNNEPTWPEGFYSKNLVIRNNFIENCMFEPVGSIAGNAQINIAFWGGTAKNQKYIFIDNNVIKSQKTPAIRFSNAHDVFVTNNNVTGSYTGGFLQISNTCNVITSNNMGIADSRIICSDLPFYTFIKKIENSITSDFNIFPNPTKDSFRITLPISQIRVISVFTLNGQLKKVLLPSEQNMYNVQGLHSGVYIVEIKSDNFRLFKRLIVE